MRINATTQNFTGYKNIISNDVFGKNARLTFFTAQLYDNNEPDLTTYKQIKTLAGMPDKDGDVISVIYAHAYNSKPQIFLDNKILYRGEELSKINNMVPAIMPEKDYKLLENIHLKTYTLLASITKRMLNDYPTSKDNGFKNSVSQFLKMFTVFTRDNDAAYQLLDLSLMKKDSGKQVAEVINKAIVKTMNRFF